MFTLGSPAPALVGLLLILCALTAMVFGPALVDKARNAARGQRSRLVLNGWLHQMHLDVDSYPNRETRRRMSPFMGRRLWMVPRNEVGSITVAETKVDGLRFELSADGRRTFVYDGDELIRSMSVFAGGDGTDDPPTDPGKKPKTLQELRDERAQVLTEIDDIIKTAKDAGRSTLEEDERKRHDDLAKRADDLENEITTAVQADEDANRFSTHEERKRRAIAAPMINRSATPPSANRSLDELLWASEESVVAGSFTEQGMFIANEYGARNSVEQVAVRTAGDEEIGVAPRLREFVPEHRQAVRNFQETVADMAIFGILVDRSAKSSRDGFEVARNHRLMKERWQSALRALDVDTASAGAWWVPTGLGASLHEKVRAAGKVAALFERIDLPTNPWKWPLEGADAIAYRVGEPTSDAATKVTASTPGTGAATFDAEIFGARTLFSRSIEADSAYAILPYARGKLVRAFVDAEEKAVLDGDSDGAHMDSDVVGTADARTSWDGLRKRALANAAADGGNVAATLALFRAARAAMGKYGLDLSRLAAIIPIGIYFDLMELAEVTTVDKYGSQATILNGELGKLYGIPLVVSEHFREDLNAAGVHDGVTQDRTGIIIVDRGEWAFGQRMALDVEVDDSIYRETFQRVVVGFMREDFQNINDDNAAVDTSMVYNLT